MVRFYKFVPKFPVDCFKIKSTRLTDVTVQPFRSFTSPCAPFDAAMANVTALFRYCVGSGSIIALSCVWQCFKATA